MSKPKRKHNMKALSDNASPSALAQRTKETIAMLMIGDGALAMVMPQAHMAVWKQGPDWWRRMIEPFERHPLTTRLIGAAEAAAGFWLASSAASGSGHNM